MRKLIAPLPFSALLPLIILLAACSDVSPDSAAQSDMWRVQLISAETARSLSASTAVVQYGGDILESTMAVLPEQGKHFLLLELSIEKVGEGKAAFSWNDAHIVDQDGNSYFRHSNDTFLANLGIPRIRGTDIVFGKESGYVCFEIPEGSYGLVFIADEGNIALEVPA